MGNNEEDYIPYGTQFIEEDDINSIVSVLTSSNLTTGPKIVEFEQHLCHYTGAKYAVAVSSGTAALHIAMMTLDLSPGDEVITSPLTFVASSNCILYCGGKPVFADIDRETFLLDLNDVERKITKKTKAIIPVHYGGELCDMDGISYLAQKYNLKIIQDCAHSLGSEFRKGNKQGEYEGQQVWSFHPVKTITTGEGGAITTNDISTYNKLRRLKTHGITRDSSQFKSSSPDGEWYYEMLDLGYNYRITDIQCALGISQLKKIGRLIKRRREIVLEYNNRLRDLPLKTQRTPDWCIPVRHLYTIHLYNNQKRKQVFDYLKRKKIGVNVHYIPVYWHPYGKIHSFK